jgi:hypothetical protein
MMGKSDGHCSSCKHEKLPSLIQPVQISRTYTQPTPQLFPDLHTV